MTTAKQYLDYLRPKQAHMVALLDELARYESPSVDAKSQHGPLEALRSAFEARGFRVRLYRGRESGGALLAAPHARPKHRPYQLLLGHADTVWPLGTIEKMPLVQEGAHLKGPGTFDMKAGLVQMLFALEAVAALDRHAEVTPVIFINTDEETGSRESTRWIRRLARGAERVFVLEPSAGTEGRLKTARKGIGRFTVRVFGRAAHAGLDPEKGASAILELSLVIQKLFALNDAERGITVNVGTIDGGLRPNVVAPESSAVVDVRVPSHEAASEVEAAIRALTATTPGTRIEVEGKMSRPPMERTENTERLFRIARSAAAEIDIELDEIAAGGGSDGNTASQLSPTLDGLGAVGDGAHAPHEFVDVERMPERAAILARLLTCAPWPDR